MADFQYLVPDLPDVLKQVTDGAVLNEDVPYHLQPPVFTRFDHPINYNYNAESAPRGNKTIKEMKRMKKGRGRHFVILT